MFAGENDILVRRDRQRAQSPARQLIFHTCQRAVAGGAGGAGEVSALSPGQGVQKPSGDSPSVGLRGWAGRAGAENNSFWRGRGWWGRWLDDQWTEQRIFQNKVIVSGQNKVVASTLQRLSSSGPTSGLTPQEGGMEGGVGSSTRGHAPVPPPPGPQVHTLPAGALFPMPTLPTPSKHPHTLSGAPQGAKAGTHTLIFMLLCNPATDNHSQGKQSAKS